MRWGCVVLVGTAVTLAGLAGASIWVGSRIFQEPDVPAAAGVPEDGIRAQRKIFEIARGEPSRRGGRAHQVVMTEAELNRFLSKHLVEVTKMPVVFGAIRLAGDGVVEFKGLVPLRDLLSASLAANLVPSAWLERRVWIYLNATASFEVGAARSQRRYLRFDVRQLAIGRQPLPGVLLRLLPSSGLQGLLRWRMPESIEGITIEPGAVAIKTSS
jgi:hypothetical protein